MLDKHDGTFSKDYVEYLNECPVCKNREYTIYCIKDKFIHKECNKCGLIYLDPKLNREATLKFYNSPVNEIYNEEKFHLKGTILPDDIENLENYSLLLKNIDFIKGMRLLEIGPGRGVFLAKATEEGFETHAIELNKHLIENLKIITDNIYSEDLQNIDFPENHFDVIYFRDVMEHIDIPIPFLSKLHRILKPSGCIFIDTHNIKSLVNSCTKQYHTVIFAFEHPVHWSPQSLKFACQKVGLNLKSQHFNHNHQSLAAIVNYKLNPSFTYINPPKRPLISFLFYRILNRLLRFTLFKSIDITISIQLSKLFGRGAKMQLIFIKK
jgi:2-polyprenyl-3-methyl-5-hydroxy-6-metoxy-1,4-benzoquinol methylase